VFSPERRYAEEVAVMMEGYGLSRAYGKLLGWLLICDPPQQSSAELAEALDLSKGSVSSGTRVLENSGLIRRVAVPGRRGKVYEMTDEGIMRAVNTDQYRVFRELMDRGVALLGDDHGPRSRRVRTTRDFYAFIERELPKLIKQFKSEQGEDSDG
jgi:DNA-binding MarR family transcriptional regulator